jgi:hypothetical protein
MAQVVTTLNLLEVHGEGEAFPVLDQAHQFNYFFQRGQGQFPLLGALPCPQFLMLISQYLLVPQ